MEAVRHADLILHIIDLSRPSCEDDYRAVLTTLDQEIFSADEPRPPIIDVLNKADLADPAGVIPLPLADGIRISAKEGWHLDRLLDRVRTVLGQGEERTSLLIPYTQSGLLYRLSQEREVRIQRYAPDGIEITVRLPAAEIARLQGAGAKVRGPSFPEETASP